MLLGSSVMIVDPDRTHRETMSKALRAHGFSVVEWEQDESALRDLDPGELGCLIWSATAFSSSGPPSIPGLARLIQSVPTLAVLESGQLSDVVEWMRAGAVDVIQKPIKWPKLHEQVGAVLAQSTARRQLWIRRAEINARLITLSPRERQVMIFITAGLTSKEAAYRLGLSRRTVEIHRGRVMKKMNASSLAELVQMVDFVAPDEMRT